MKIIIIKTTIISTSNENIKNNNRKKEVENGTQLVTIEKVLGAVPAAKEQHVATRGSGGHALLHKRPERRQARPRTNHHDRHLPRLYARTHHLLLNKRVLLSQGAHALTQARTHTCIRKQARRHAQQLCPCCVSFIKCITPFPLFKVMVCCMYTTGHTNRKKWVGREAEGDLGQPEVVVLVDVHRQTVAHLHAVPHVRAGHSLARLVVRVVAHHRHGDAH